MKKWLLACFALFSFSALANVNLRDVQLKDLNLQPIALNQYQGKPLYIKMWASWCSICLATLEETDALSGQQSQDFAVITVVSPNHLHEKSTQKFVQWFKGLEYKNLLLQQSIQGYLAPEKLREEMSKLK